jgi:hypothetical protein
MQIVGGTPLMKGNTRFLDREALMTGPLLFSLLNWPLDHS